MRLTKRLWAGLRRTPWILGIAIGLCFVLLLLVRLFGMQYLRRLVHVARAVVDSQSVTSYSLGEFTNVVFLHHSTGHNLIEQGTVRERFTQAGFDFWDHDYNWPGLRRPDGTYADYNYGVPGDNTDPDGLANILSQRAHRLPLNALSGLLQHEVIILKSCFPVSHIADDDQLDAYKSHYLAMRDVMDQCPDKVFVLMTPPPLNPAATDATAAARARAFSEWLASDVYLDRHSNVFTFDFFDHLAEADPTSPDHNMLRAAYRDGTDSHPNRAANEATGPLLVEFVIHAVRSYRGGSGARV